MKVAYVLATLKFLNYCLYTLIVPFFPIILADKGLSEKWIGYIFRYIPSTLNSIFSAYPMSSIIFTPLMGVYITKLGRKKALLHGCAISVRELLIGISLFARVLQGLANALTQPTCKNINLIHLAQSILLIYYNGNITKPMSIMEVSGALGATFGPFIGSTLNYLFGYEGPFIVFSILYMQIFSFMITYIPSDENIHEKRENMDKLPLAKRGREESENFELLMQQIGNTQQSALNYGFSMKSQDVIQPMIGQNEKIYMTDPDDEYFNNKEYDYNYGRNDYVGFHPFFDDLPKPIHHKRKENIPPLSNYLKEFDWMTTSYRQSSYRKGEKIQTSQLRILFKNLQVFGTIFTFFVSTCLWVYIEPILSLYLVKQYQLADYTTPLFFLVFSVGYLTATFSLIKSNRLQTISSKAQSVVAFILAGVSQVMISPPQESCKQVIILLKTISAIWLTSLGLFLFGFFTTFTLVPIYNDMLRSLEKHFDLNRMSLSEVIDLCSSLTVFLKSAAQVIAPIIGTYLYEWYGFSYVCLIFSIVSIIYGFFLMIIL
ncbi:major facilitator superfamily protein [Stylonychia lemnae]|uniref:Major facilitator superfamily protein n=1 Tax=Stylonychia lemnae TaxID=5949 RepID=A0A077ZV46_STYLE|nr:major facilitator superfamily protein [Stylonychia lemnae]|eukprot:CDW73170.1 major facilitator superfamily protein [Stylonychia lemnae]